ncbi:MAG: HU family DNA-binding protein [Myxococcota bacterium]|nr:HU family DNA-binding protein [Myxococcota bacterium]
MANTSLNKTDLINTIADDAGLTKADAERALLAALEGIQNGLQINKKVTLVGFGTFSLSHRNARKGRNPQTGNEINIPASNAVKFKAGTTLKKSVN